MLSQARAEPRRIELRNKLRNAVVEAFRDHAKVDIWMRGLQRVLGKSAFVKRVWIRMDWRAASGC